MDICNSGGIILTLEFGNNQKNDDIAVPVIQLIIRDCKGNDLLCGRKSGHSRIMNGLCCDFDIKPLNGDITCIRLELVYSISHKDNIIEKTTNELEE